MKNTIAERIADFLKNFPPFDRIDKADVLCISKEVSVYYFEKGKTVYAAGDQLQDKFYIIHKGAVILQKEVLSKSETVDHFDEGDVFGLRPLFAKENYNTSAITEEESILYGIPLSVFKPLIAQNKEIVSFLIESFASNTENPFSKELDNNVFQSDVNFGNKELYELQPVIYTKKVKTASPETSIKAIAMLMRKHHIGCVVIESNMIPLGIITNKDLRNKVITGEHGIDEKASEIMSSPVLCYPSNVSMSQAQIAMLKHNVGHLCITEDGTPNSKIIGILSQHDITMMRGSNPSVLMKAIKRSNSTKELKRIHKRIMVLLDGLMQQNIPLTQTSKIIFELYDASIKRIIERCIEKMGKEPPVKFAWMSLGSQGRKEQLLHTDQDNAIIFENVPSNELEKTRLYFLQLAKKVTKRLNIIGFDFCAADMMAKNPKWCLTLDEWKEQFSNWTTNTGDDEILLSSIFFDFDISFGDATLTNELADHVLKLTKDNDLFLAKLGASALRSASPLGFFRQFLVEPDGEHKDFFDLKKRALMPIVDAGRLLALRNQIKNINNTAERFEKMAELFPDDKEFYLSCSYTTKALLKFRTKQGLLHNDSGRFIELAALSKEEKLKLKRCFKTIARVQDYIKLKFNLNNFL
ncbi:DUF294 nucleotidyltransferase-like domain-containing protein [Subsaxibacter sp. CAU 1640]|uniref:DUF294 nucleotidyltransferase-like domain-containing protein n=1 Tax=Subsaxibacter sp. CAU 1640 TaxID=2933271 RepID=UPI0020033876|nr:DUF294 nucleotidyltransferase-like domain-containing protein [Subsaxibacter sp. CAU 1640]MCK7591161.1 DUF294 nucleotidyltransferase-like domain-containing protein [Subsaxibacter sp. CAU 1640]